MAIKSDIKHAEDANRTFPAFYVCTSPWSKRFIVLVTAQNGNKLTGTVVTTGNNNIIGDRSESWDAAQFERLRGSFTVTQD